MWFTAIPTVLSRHDRDSLSSAAKLTALATATGVIAAYGAAKSAVKEHGALPVPLHLRNAPTRLMKNEGYGRGYKYPHDFDGHVVEQEYLPEPLAGVRFYEPSDSGYEGRIRARLDAWQKRRQES